MATPTNSWSWPVTDSQLIARVSTLESVFRRIRSTRMAGVPLLHPGLRVQAVGFEGEGTDVLGGVLLTPWFMSLVRLPLRPRGVADAPWLAVGHKQWRTVGSAEFEFIGASEQDVGVFETASLFSPMAEFVDHAAALATAHEVLRQLRTRPETVPVPQAPAAPAQPEAEPAPSRRGFLFGRNPAAGAPR